MARKHYKIEIILEAPLPVKFVYREEANAARAAIGRALARFRADIPGRPIRDLTIKLRLKDTIEGLTGRPDDVVGSDDLEADEANTSLKQTKQPVVEDDNEEDEEEEVEEEEEEEDEDEQKPTKSKKDKEPVVKVEEDETEDEIEEDVTTGDEDEEDADEGVDADELIKLLASATSDEEIKKLKLKYIDPYEWPVAEMKKFDTQIGLTKASWNKTTKKLPGKDPLDDGPAGETAFQKTMRVAKQAKNK